MEKQLTPIKEEKPKPTTEKVECKHPEFKYYQDRRICIKCGYTIYGDTGER